MKPAKSKTRLVSKAPSRTKLNSRDPVQVFCRLRPLPVDQDITPSIKVIPPNTVLVTPTENVISKNGIVKTMKYTFKEVFSPDTTQHEVFNKVAYPLVENLVKGKNGLLFTYGVTGSGKTYTMTGESQNCGILPRCLDLIFRTISDFQAKKFTFVPDKMNMFDIYSEAEALLLRQQELCRQPKPSKKNNSYPDLTVISSAESTKVDGLDEDNQYAVFITYIEVYNNSVYDLLEEMPSSNKSLQPKIVREDAAHNMYVHGVTEIEVKSPEEAFDVFHKGGKKKRMAHTTLNAESSRSHSVFTIRLVQAPIDEMGEAVVQDKNCSCISQLSLVDLAGSERTNRTKNTGQRLREAGNINNSLMTLRACMEALRENQMNGQNKMVPYRDSKITHLFKNFFDGEGHVRMIICVNPSSDDYDETLQVMRFAEMASEVEIARPVPIELGVGMTPGRRKANKLFKAATQKLVDSGRPEARELEVDLGLVYSLGPDFPSLEMNSCDADHIIKELIAHLQMRIEKREQLKRQKAIRDEQFRCQLLELEKTQMMTAAECNSMRSMLSQEKKRRQALEDKLVQAESSVSNLNRKLEQVQTENMKLKRELQEKDMILSQTRLEREKQKRKYTHKIEREHEKMSRELELKLKEQQDKLKSDMRDKDNKIRLVTKILTGSGDLENAPVQASPAPMPLTEISNMPSCRMVHTPAGTTSAGPPSSRRGVAVANPRHRRSLSADGCGRGWLEHTPSKLVPLGTVLKPIIHHGKNVTKLTSVKDIANSKTSKYCLVSQEQDTDGELETRFYKGDVVPTCGGGAQVIFNDVEMLKQTSPSRMPPPASVPCTANTPLPQSPSQSHCPRHNKRREHDLYSENKKFKTSSD